MRGGLVWMESERFLNQVHGELVAANLSGENAEVMEGFGVAGLGGEDLAVQGLGIREPPGLVVLERKGEGLWDRDRGHGGF